MARGLKTSEMLLLCSQEYARAVGIRGDEINAQREIGLNYFKGVMDDLPHAVGRSSATTSDVADAIETVLPDLIEIFTGSDDVATFSPNGPDDEEAATQETDYINHVFYQENPGFLNIYTMIKDALQEKTGILKVYGTEVADPDEEFENRPLDEFLVAYQEYGPERVELDTEGVFDEVGAIILDEFGLPVVPFVDFTIKGEKHFKACVCTVPPEDFAVSQDTVELYDSPYCAHRTRLRAYELIRRGIPRSVVDQLPTYGFVQTTVKMARDTSDTLTAEQVGSPGDHRIVEVVEHYLDTHKGRIRMVTDGSCAIVVEKPEYHERVPFAAICPFPVAHQFYGQSLADKLIEIQKIKTTLLRMLLDSGYFALNQRNYINMKNASQWTMTDLMRNEPNVPVRGNGPASETIMPLTSGGLNFPALEMMETVSVMGELRSGVMRNTQGLNPETLHETASGAMALMAAGQRRVRLVARIFAETGIKDVFLILHNLIRENVEGQVKARLRGKWVELAPTEWQVRKDMTIEIGVGAGNQDAMMMTQGLEFMQGVIQMQGGIQGPFVTQENVYAFGKRFLETGLKFQSADPYWSDPATQEPKPPQPDPEAMKLQAEQQMQQQKLEFEKEKAAASMEVDRMKAEANLELERMKAEANMMLEQERSAANLEFEREKATQEMLLAREKAEFEAQLAMQKAEAEAEIAMLQIESSERTAMSKNRPGGDLDK